VLARTSTATAPNVNQPHGLSALRGVEAAELLRVIAALHLEGLLSDAEYLVKRRRLVAEH
jgi:hypothetical protein